MKTPYEVIFTTIIITLIMSFTAFVGLKVIDPSGIDNDRLSTESKRYIIGLDNETGGRSSFSAASEETNVTGSFQDADAEVRQYLESKSEASQIRQVVTQFSNLPDLFFYTIGVNNTVIAKIIGWLVTLSILITSLVVYRLFFGGGRITRY